MFAIDWTTVASVIGLFGGHLARYLFTLGIFAIEISRLLPAASRVWVVDNSFTESGVEQTSLGKSAADCASGHFPMKTAAEYRAMAEECVKAVRRDCVSSQRAMASAALPTSLSKLSDLARAVTAACSAAAAAHRAVSSGRTSRP